MNKNEDVTAIFIAYEDGVSDEEIGQIQFGLEEESIPYAIVESTLVDARELADYAAGISRLGIGIGIDKSGYSCVTSDNFEEKSGIFYSRKSKEALRDLGSNGARLLKGIPFKV